MTNKKLCTFQSCFQHVCTFTLVLTISLGKEYILVCPFEASPFKCPSVVTCKKVKKPWFHWLQQPLNTIVNFLSR